QKRAREAVASQFSEEAFLRRISPYVRSCQPPSRKIGVGDKLTVGGSTRSNGGTALSASDQRVRHTTQPAPPSDGFMITDVQASVPDGWSCSEIAGLTIATHPKTTWIKRVISSESALRQPSCVVVIGAPLDVVHLTTSTERIVDQITAHFVRGGDRKSTRLNSSHVKISYAVICLFKKHKNI